MPITRPAKAAAATEGTSSVPPFEVRVLTRAAFGPARRAKKTAAAAPADRIFGGGFEVEGDIGQDDLGYFRSLGQTDDERLAAWVEEQLDPQVPPEELKRRLEEVAAKIEYRQRRNQEAAFYHDKRRRRQLREAGIDLRKARRGPLKI